LTLTPARHTRDHSDNLTTQEPINMGETLSTPLEPPRFVDGKPFLVAGLSERYSCDTSMAIPSQWQRFGAYFGKLLVQVGNVAYGVCYNADAKGNFDYLCGVEVSDASALPDALIPLPIEAQRYAVFNHRDSISTLRLTMAAIWTQWLPSSGYVAANAPNFERYDEKFDPVSGTGGLEIWVPLQR
jgi:AraC family transcriptional regulator